LSIQSAFQTRNIDASCEALGLDKYYEGKASAPVIPSVFAAYKKGDWTISGFFGNLFGGFGGPAQFVGRGFGAYGMYASGGIADRPSIFGEAGPEAAVPLPDGRTIPVTFTNGGGGSEVLIRLDQGLVAQILKQADSNAVKVVDSRAPAAVARTQRNGGL